MIGQIALTPLRFTSATAMPNSQTRHGLRHSFRLRFCLFVCKFSRFCVFAIIALVCFFFLDFFASCNGGGSGGSGAFIHICASLNFIVSEVAGWRRAPSSLLLHAVAAHYFFRFRQTFNVNCHKFSVSVWSCVSLQNARNSDTMARK